MSFSGKVREELALQISSARHCQLSELSALISFCTDAAKPPEEALQRLQTENDAVVRKYFTLLKKTFNIDDAVCLEDAKRVLEAVSSPGILHKSCCRRAYLRGVFLAVGSVSDPEKSYHMEFVCTQKEQADQIRELLSSFEIESKEIVRKKYHVVYIKEGSQIVETLNVIGAHVALMDYENSRILKDMRNSVNRRVNCETANIDKTVNAAMKQTEDITLVMNSNVYRSLPDTLKAVAEARLNNPEASLKELGEMMTPPVGKSGINHRLRKLSSIADWLRMKEEQIL